MTFFSGCVAFSVNLSIFWIIGNTSPVTYPCNDEVINKLKKKKKKPEKVLFVGALGHEPWTLSFLFADNKQTWEITEM